MVGRLMGLKWAQFYAQFRSSGWVVAGLVIGGIYCLGVLIAISVGFAVAGAGLEPELICAAGILVGMAVLVPWLVVPLVTPTADPLLDAEALAPYPLTSTQILLGQLFSSVVGLFGLCTALAFLTPMLGWWHHPLGMLVAPVGTVLAWATTTSLSRLVSAGAQALSLGRRGIGNVVGAVAFILAMLALPLINVVLAVVLTDSQILSRVGSVGSWLPVGSAMALPGDLVQGDVAVLAAHLGLSVLYLAAALLGWGRVIRWQRAVVGGQPRRRRGSGTGTAGLFDRLPASPAGAIAVRTLLYLFRDPRFSLNLMVIPAFFLLFWLMAGGLASGEPSPFQLMLFGPMAAMIVGWQLGGYIVSYDHSAFSLHVSSPLSGAEDRRGRYLALLTVVGPTLLLLDAAAVLLAGEPLLLPGHLGVTANVLLAALGLGAVFSIRFAYPVPPPGVSPWRMQRNGAGAANVLMQLAGTALLLLLGLPALILLIIAAITAQPLWSWMALLLGSGVGMSVFWVGLRLGGTWYDRRAPELLQEVSRFR